jgi:predicted ATPase
MNKVIVFDIDGTLANVEHRRPYIASRPKNWPAWNAGIPQDTAHEEIVFLAKTFHDGGHTIILCSGRSDDLAKVTIAQMAKFGVEYKELYMRKTGDHRPDSIVKVELLNSIRMDYGEPYLWFDDRQQVVDAIRAEGVRVLQVAPGDF